MNIEANIKINNKYYINIYVLILSIIYLNVVMDGYIYTPFYGCHLNICIVCRDYVQ